LLPNVLALPHTSHFPDTTFLPDSLVYSVSRWAVKGRIAEPGHVELRSTT
jgi:hypothetical protein